MEATIGINRDNMRNEMNFGIDITADEKTEKKDDVIDIFNEVSNITEEEILLRFSKQTEETEKSKNADIIINNFPPYNTEDEIMRTIAVIARAIANMKQNEQL